MILYCIIQSLGYSALMWAAREGNTEIVAQLVKSKSLLDLQDPVCYSSNTVRYYT